MLIRSWQFRLLFWVFSNCRLFFVVFVLIKFHWWSKRSSSYNPNIISSNWKIILLGLLFKVDCFLVYWILFLAMKDRWIVLKLSLDGWITHDESTNQAIFCLKLIISLFFLNLPFFLSFLLFFPPFEKIKRKIRKYNLFKLI